MQTRALGSTGLQVSVVGLGAWQIGGDWGTVADDDAIATLHAAVDAGVTFVDTADVYGDGRSELLVGRLLRERGGEGPGGRLVVATKAGRRLTPQVAEGYTRANLDAFVDRSLANLGVDRLDLVQLHCPPTAAYYDPEVYGAMAAIRDAGKVAHWGVSVEKVEEAQKAVEQPVVQTVQIILNAFRQRPADRFLADAAAADVGVIARVPLASGLLTGRLTRDSDFAEDDHRRYNRHGEAFDVGETFAGVPYEVGLAAVDRLRPIVGDGDMPVFALRWVLSQEGVTTVIPGASRPDQARANAAVGAEPPLAADQLAAVRAVYDELIQPHVHIRW